MLSYLLFGFNKFVNQKFKDAYYHYSRALQRICRQLLYFMFPLLVSQTDVIKT